MQNIPKDVVEVGASFEQAYRPVLDFCAWKVAMLRRFDVVDPQRVHRVERHTNTNEVFILTEGEADLIVFEGDGEPREAHVFPMQRNVAYNIKRSVWHHVVMSPEAHIVLFEKSGTGPETTDYAELDPETVAGLKGRFSVGGAA